MIVSLDSKFPMEKTPELHELHATVFFERAL